MSTPTSPQTAADQTPADLTPTPAQTIGPF